MGNYEFTGAQIHNPSIGDNAFTVNITYGAQPEGVKDAFTALRDAVAQGGHEAAVTEVENLARDLDEPRPNRKLIQQRIATITAAAGAASAVATAAEHLTRIVSSWLS